MDRIVLIGNGFDKAHGLPTGYNDFMSSLIDSIVKYEKSGSRVTIKIGTGQECGKNRGFYHRITHDGKEDKWIGARDASSGFNFKLALNPHGKSIYFKSLIQHNDQFGYWSDLESHYFKVLFQNKSSMDDIKLINSEFEHLKNLLFDYLKKEIEDNIGVDKKITPNTLNPIFNMLKFGHNDLEFEKNYFVTFNYTSKILNQYVMWLKSSFGDEIFPLMPVHIHGNLIDPTNPIIFGYGDENSSEYNELELMEQNDLLINFKTFQYLRSNTYSQVLGLLEGSSEIYVQLIGHSSGLCDKALLRSIFQHDNVKYIESTFYSSETKYFENLYNISRIFDDNTLMRKKLIPLHSTFCIDE